MCKRERAGTRGAALPGTHAPTERGRGANAHLKPECWDWPQGTSCTWSHSALGCPLLEPGHPAAGMGWQLIGGEDFAETEQSILGSGLGRAPYQCHPEAPCGKQF